MRLPARKWSSLRVAVTEVTGHKMEVKTLYVGDRYVITNGHGTNVVQLTLGRGEVAVDLLAPMLEISPEVIAWAKTQ